MMRNFKNGVKTKKRGRSWRLFHATNFQSLMYPNFILSNILGIFPYRIKASSFELSKPRYILWTIISCVTCVYQLTLLYQFNVFERINSDTTKIINHNFSFIYGLCITVVSYILSGPRMRLLQSISDISSKLPQQSYRKLSKLIHVKDIFGFFFLLWLLSMYSILSKPDLVIINVSFDSFKLYVSLLGFQMDMLYVNCVCVLTACFKEINDNLENLRELMMNNMPSRIYHKQRYPFLMKLKILKKQHVMISNTVQMLNVNFGLHLLVTIALCFKQIIFYIYFGIIQWQDGISFNLNKFHDMYFMLFLMYHLLITILIVWACETGKNQAMKIGTTIHDVLNNTNDVQIKNELQLFSLQILHYKNTFSAKGFTVDATLLTAIVNGITTYLIILVQFLIMSHSCDKKKNVIN